MFGVGAHADAISSYSYLTPMRDDRCDVSGVVCRPGSLKKRDLFPAAPQGCAESDMRPQGAWQVPCAVPGGHTTPEAAHATKPLFADPRGSACYHAPLRRPPRQRMLPSPSSQTPEAAHATKAPLNHSAAIAVRR